MPVWNQNQKQEKLWNMLHKLPVVCRYRLMSWYLISCLLLICLQISHILFPLSGALRLHSTVFLINNWADDYVWCERCHLLKQAHCFGTWTGKCVFTMNHLGKELLETTSKRNGQAKKRKNTLGSWLDEPSVCRGLTSQNQSDQQ